MISSVGDTKKRRPRLATTPPSLSLSVPTWAQVLFPANGVVQLLVAPERRAVYVLSRLAARQVEAQDSEMDGEEMGGEEESDVEGAGAGPGPRAGMPRAEAAFDAGP